MFISSLIGSLITYFLIQPNTIDLSISCNEVGICNEDQISELIKEQSTNPINNVVSNRTELSRIKSLALKNRKLTEQLIALRSELEISRESRDRQNLSAHKVNRRNRNIVDSIEDFNNEEINDDWAIDQQYKIGDYLSMHELGFNLKIEKIECKSTSCNIIFVENRKWYLAQNFFWIFRSKNGGIFTSTSFK